MPCGGSFDIDKRREKIAAFDEKMSTQGFWDDPQAAKKTVDEANAEKVWVDEWDEMDAKWTDLHELYQLAEMENDEGVLTEIEHDLGKLESEINDLEFRRMMSDPADKKNAIITVHPGAGGTESTDWASMLMRMYMRWAERKGYGIDILDLQEGEEAGIKSVSIEITGAYAYGYLKAESGVHRLVRISPFDSQKRRHTSFASVFIYPEIDEEIDFEVDENEVRVDTYRASGAGGQHVNKTDSAIRITHFPTGIVITCQDESSQHKNKEKAMKILYSRVYSELMEAQENAIARERKTQVSTGDRSAKIRTYNFPQGRVTDHRIGLTLHNLDSVLEGNIDELIEELAGGFGHALAAAGGDARVLDLVTALGEGFGGGDIGGIVVRQLDDQRVSERRRILDAQAEFDKDLAGQKDQREIIAKAQCLHLHRNGCAVAGGEIENAARLDLVEKRRITVLQMQNVFLRPCEIIFCVALQGNFNDAAGHGETGFFT